MKTHIEYLDELIKKFQERHQSWSNAPRDVRKEGRDRIKYLEGIVEGLKIAKEVIE